MLVSTAPRPHIPLTISPANHPLWNPAEDSKRMVDRDETGRIEKFESKFSFGAFDLASLDSGESGAEAPSSKKGSSQSAHLPCSLSCSTGS